MPCLWRLVRTSDTFKPKHTPGKPELVTNNLDQDQTMGDVCLHFSFACIYWAHPTLKTNYIGENVKLNYINCCSILHTKPSRDSFQSFISREMFDLLPSCSVYCSSPPRVQHGAHNGPGEAEQFPLETVLKYTCYPGYLAVGFAHAKCFLYNTSAQWFGPDLTCKRKRLSIFRLNTYTFWQP